MRKSYRLNTLDEYTLISRISIKQIRKTIKKTGTFTGYICGCKVKPEHISNGWDLGLKFSKSNISDFDKYVKDFRKGIRQNKDIFGRHPHLYQYVQKYKKKG